MNPLSEYPTARRYVYAGLWLIGLVLTAAQIWVGAVPDVEQPVWLTGALAVFPAVAAYVGYTAQQNVPSYEGRHGDDPQPLVARH